MYYYFNSEFPAIIKIDGIYKGLINEVNQFEISCQSFIEICPLSRSENAFYFILNDDFLFNPPKGVIITDLDGGYLVSFTSLEQVSSFNVISQKKLPYSVITVFKENGLNLSIETQNDFYAETLEFSCSNATITEFTLTNTKLVAIYFFGKKKILNCYLINEKIKKIFSREIFEFSFENGFSTTEIFYDIAKHKITYNWVFEENSLKKSTCKIERKEDYQISKLSTHLLPYAFFEEFMLSDQVEEFLSKNVHDNLNFLREYLGNYIGVMPPPKFRDYNEIGLIYCIQNNRYQVKYFCVTIEDNKIVNINYSNKKWLSKKLSHFI